MHERTGFEFWLHLKNFRFHVYFLDFYLHLSFFFHVSFSHILIFISISPFHSLSRSQLGKNFLDDLSFLLSAERTVGLVSRTLQDSQSRRHGRQEGPHLYEGHEEFQNHICHTNPTKVSLCMCITLVILKLICGPICAYHVL